MKWQQVRAGRKHPLMQLICLALILFINISNFAAVVSDNDGSAFITKAEFDSLKNNFQSQIDQYNQSIDSKIDGAIAQYLDGIKLANQWELYDISKFKFTSAIKATTEQGKNYSFNLERQSNRKALTNLIGGTSWYLIAWIPNSVVDYGLDHPTSYADAGVVADIAVGSWGGGCWYEGINFWTTALDWSIPVDDIRYDTQKGAILIKVEVDDVGVQQYDQEWAFALLKAQDTWTGLDYNSWVWGAIDCPSGGEYEMAIKDRSLDAFAVAHPDISLDWLRSNAIMNDVLGIKCLKIGGIDIIEGDSSDVKTWKNELQAWRAYNQAYTYGLNYTYARSIRQDLAYFCRNIEMKLIWNDIGDTKWGDYLDSKKVIESGQEVVHLRDLYESCPIVAQSLYGSGAKDTEFNDTRAAAQNQSWSDNNYGKGFLVDTKVENGETVRYLSGYSDKIAAQLYYDSQVHTYSEVTGNGNKQPTNWDDTYNGGVTYEFEPTYEIKESNDPRQQSTSTKNFNSYWKKSIYPYILKEENDDTEYMMLGRPIQANQRAVWTFDANNALETTPVEQGTVTIPANDTIFNRTGQWNDNGTLTEKNDYTVQTGDISFPTYKIKQEQNSIYDLVNSKASTIANRPVKLSSGVLCAKVNDQRIGSKARFKLKIYNATSGMEVSGKSVNWKLSDDMFKNLASLSEGARLLASGTAQSGEMIVTEPFDSPNNVNEVWLSVYFSTPNDNNYIIKVEEFSIS